MTFEIVTKKRRHSSELKDSIHLAVYGIDRGKKYRNASVVIQLDKSILVKIGVKEDGLVNVMLGYFEDFGKIGIVKPTEDSAIGILKLKRQSNDEEYNYPTVNFTIDNNYFKGNITKMKVDFLILNKRIILKIPENLLGDKDKL